MASDARTPRDRVLQAFDHKEPDRIPIDFGSKGSGLGLLAYEELKKALSMDAGTEVLDKRLGLAVIDEQILERFNVDTRYVYMKAAKDWNPRINLQEDTFVDEWGGTLRRPQGGFYYDHVDYPIKEPTLQAIEEHQWPDPFDKSRVEGVAEEAKAYRDRGYALGTYFKGAWETGWIVRGLENCMTDIYLNQAFYRALMDKITDVLATQLSVFLDEIGPYVDFVCMTEDLGTQLNFIVSPETYREFIRPSSMRLFKVIKEKTNAKITQHSCGAIFGLIPDIIEAGVEMLNPIQVTARGMDSKRLKAEYGRDLVFWGGVDSQQTLIDASVGNVRDEVKRIIADLAPGGGFMLAPTHDIQNFTPPENIIALYETALEYGAY
jgi:uroporphyrinogen decarboxylase